MDKRLVVVRPGGWILLAAVTVVAVVALGWGWLGAAQTRVFGIGVLMSDGESTREVVATTAGIYQQRLVNAGDQVSEGQPLARLTLNEASQEIRNAERELAAFGAERKRLIDYYADYLAKQTKANEIERANLQSAIRNGDKKVEAARKVVEGQETLRKTGIASQITLNAARESLYGAEVERDQFRLTLSGLDAKILTLENQREQALAQLQSQIVQAENRIASARRRIEEDGVVRSPIAGRVTLLTAAETETIAVGQPLMVIEKPDRALVATVYVPANDAKRVQVGMPANVTPTTIKPEEDGNMIGTVKLVEAVQETRESMQRVLHNNLLVDRVASGGPQFRVVVSLVRRDGSDNGYAWTSVRGEKVSVSDGTPVNASVVVRAQPPATLIIPALRRLVGVEAG